jgi:hypothetical protein
MLKLASLLLLAMTSMSTAGSRSMKGWELYSWFDMACSAHPNVTSAPNPDAVCFALLPGTNRNKTRAEIVKTPLGIAQLEVELGKLAKGEEVFWSAPSGGSFDLPDPKQPASDPRHRAVATAKKLGLTLTIVR